MPDRNNVPPDNVPGKWYIDASCIDCNLCVRSAPETFRRNDAEGRSYVHRQPVTEGEIERARAAAEECPTTAIGEERA
ncbi:MAG: ferredoxin [Planctomycetes bacterium]|nr:ferredoxin [Planctomycetota bacterium]